MLDILDNLHLPPEWKSLLDAAGVPRIVLEDPEVTRSIVEFVHLSLNVSDSSSSIPTSGGGLSESMIDQERQMIDLEVVSAFEMLTRKQKEKSYRTLVPALSSLASSVGDDRDRSDVNNDISDVWDIQVHSTPVAEDSDTPRALSQMEKSKEDLKITELYTHESRPRTVIGSSAEPIRSQISEDVLRNQRAKLRPTTVAPHPSQLANLASVDEGKLNTIAAVIKQAGLFYSYQFLSVNQRSELIYIGRVEFFRGVDNHVQFISIAKRKVNYALYVSDPKWRVKNERLLQC